MIHALYTGAACVAVGAVYLPLATVRRITRGVPMHVAARLGRSEPLPGSGPRAWLHAVSVGEVITATPLVEGLRRRYPSHPLVLTTVTDTGARVARERFRDEILHRYLPIDLPGAVRRATQAIDPAFFICMETELWPNLLRDLARRRVPVMIANGRVSDRSFRRYQLVRRFMREVLGDVTVFAMRSPEDARRIIALGAQPERVFVTGNIKHEVGADDDAGVAELWRRLLGLTNGRPTWVAGSTHRGEEDAVLSAHAEACRRFPDLALVLAPRHPERVPEVNALIRSRGWTPLRRSDLPRRSTGDGPFPIVVLDTVGELAQRYAVADIVFVGGSLVAAGGHNLLEPAARGKPVLTGPHVENFREAAELLTRCGAASTITDAPSLGAALVGLLAEPPLREHRGAAGRAAVASRHGAVRETLELAARFLATPERA